MAKDKERKLAKELYVHHHKTAKEISIRLNVTEKTIGGWVNKYGWKAQRDATLNKASSRIENIKEVISSMTERRIEIINQTKEADKNKDLEALSLLKEEAVKIDDGISKWNKTLENFEKENRISLSVYLEVMNDVFENLNNYNRKLYLNTLDFQDNHLNTISLKLG